ncbi:MAG: UbiA family prenyltransferase [Cytophagales bacterium]|nr:UbiA family prenyltransferase [Cytophagales bacterium]
MSFFSMIRGAMMASRIPNLVIIGLAQYLSADMLLRLNMIDSIGLSFALLMVSTMMVAAGGYVINDYYDAKIDMINRPESVVVGRSLSRRKTLVLHTTLSVAAILIGLIVSWKLALIHFLAVTALWYYSNHLRRYFIGKFAIAVLTAGSMLIVGFLYGVDSHRLMAFTAFGSAIVWIRELIKDMESIRGESAYGVESVTKVWGILGTKSLIGTIAAIGSGLLTYFIVKINSELTLYYYLSLIPILIVFVILLVRADRPTRFKRLRQLTNILILAGLTSMLFVK